MDQGGSSNITDTVCHSSAILGRVGRHIEVLNEEETFKLCTFHDILDERTLTKLKDEIKHVNLELNASDMMHLHQSADLSQIDQLDDLPYLKKVITNLKTNIRKQVEEIFHVETSEEITATISSYKKGDFLLCHDDKSGTRAVAFILYLSDLLEEEDGGELRFFSTYPGDRDPKQDRYFKKVKPAENTLLMFNVSDFSFHEVEQVYVDKERLSINGWYHLPSPLDESLTCVKINQKSKVLQLEMAIKPILKQEKIISRMLLSDMFLDSVAAAFQESDEAGIIIPNVLDTEFYRTCVNEFESIEDMYWNDVGPANYRNYSTTEFEIEGPHLFFGESLFYIGNIVDYLLSNDFLNILTRITGATYAVFGPYVPPSAMVEVQRWKQGNYTLLCDNDIERDQTSIEVTVVFHLKKDLINSYEENGLVTRTRKYPKLTDSEKNSKIRTKIQRMLADHEWKSNRYPPRKRVKFEKLTKKLAAIASEKLRKINEHRSKMQDIVSQFIVEDNQMLITAGKNDLAKFYPYIRKPNKTSEEICFYAVSVTYFLAE